MEDNKCLDSGKIVTYNRFKEEKYKVVKNNYKQELSKLRNDLWINRLEAHGKALCVVSTALVTGLLFYDAYLSKEMTFAYLGAGSAFISLISGVTLPSNSRKEKVKEIKQKRKLLKREYKAFKDSNISE